MTYSQNGIFSGIDASATLQVEGFVARADADTSAYSDQVGPRYFQTIGARIVRGRDIDERDGASAPRVAVINETMARFYFGGQDPIGRSLRIDDVRFEIVGVVADVVGQSLRDDPSRRFYTALAQGGGAGTIVFAVRTAGDPAQHTAAIRREILAADPSLRLKAPQTVAALVQESIAPERLMARLAGIAGVVALALTALGLYGVMTYAIVRRTKEFGLRMALGAQSADLTRMVLRETLILVLFGAAIGIPAALGAARLIRSQLVGVGLVDLPTLAIALALLGAIAVLAAYRPARRAAMVAPHVALGQD